MSLDRDNLEAWLTEHPEAKDDLADLSHLAALYQSVGPPDPDEAAWNAVQARIHESILRGQSRHDRWPRLRWAIAGLIAASLLLGVLVMRPWGTTNGPAPVLESSARAEEPFPVVDADEVTIISMDARDVAGLVVGTPPVWGNLEFARPEDIHVIHCARCPVSGRMARLEQEGEVPMFVTAATVAAPDEDED